MLPPPLASYYLISLLRRLCDTSDLSIDPRRFPITYFRSSPGFSYSPFVEIHSSSHSTCIYSHPFPCMFDPRSLCSLTIPAMILTNPLLPAHVYTSFPFTFTGFTSTALCASLNYLLSHVPQSGAFIRSISVAILPVPGPLRMKDVCRA